MCRRSIGRKMQTKNDTRTRVEFRANAQSTTITSMITNVQNESKWDAATSSEIFQFPLFEKVYWCSSSATFSSSPGAFERRNIVIFVNVSKILNANVVGFCVVLSVCRLMRRVRTKKRVIREHPFKATTVIFVQKHVISNLHICLWSSRLLIRFFPVDSEPMVCTIGTQLFVNRNANGAKRELVKWKITQFNRQQKSMQTQLYRNMNLLSEKQQ